MRIRGGSGLGDSIYVRPIVDHFVRSGARVTVLSDFPDVFIGSGAEVQPFARDRIQVLAHYVAGKDNPATNQWQDICRSARAECDLAIRWPVQSPARLAAVQSLAGTRPIVLVHGGRAPMGRKDGFGMEMMPDRAAFDLVLAEMPGCFLVGIGGLDGEKYEIPVDLDLRGKTSVADLLDLATACAAVVAQCSFAVPLAEVFDKPLLAVWAAPGMQSPTPYVRTITPAKILSKPTSTHVVDDWAPIQIQEVAHAFRPV